MRAQTMYDRLSSVTQRIPGLKLTQMTTTQGGGYFISTDMFYIEVLMDPSRVKVTEVKVAHSSEPSPCPVLTQVLFNNDLETFARHLEGLASIYQLNADKKQKSRAYTALTSLETDLSRFASCQSNTINSCFNILHKSPVGVMEPRKGGLPVRLTYFISPYDLVDVSKKEVMKPTISNTMDKNLGLSVTIGIEGSNTSHVLQFQSLISIHETPEGKSLPSSAPNTAQNSASLPAHFVMKLSKPMPISLEFIKKIDQIIKIQEFSLNLPQESLINLIARQQLETSTSDDGLDFRKSVFCANILNQHHMYHVSGLQVDRFVGSMVTKIPFTHPTNIPNILMLLRQQALFNFVIGSCIRECKSFDSPILLEEKHNTDVQILDINPISLSSICVTFEHPSKESLATLEIDLRDINDIRCQLHALNMDTVCSDDYASKVLQKCWSIPITMKCVIKKCFEKTTLLQEEIVRKREREMEELLKNNSQQVYQNQLTQSSRDTSNPYFFENVHGEILSDNLLFPQNQSTSTNLQNSSMSTGASSASFLLAGLTDSVHRSTANYNSSGSDVSSLSQSQYLKRFVCQPKAKTDLQPSLNTLRLSSLPNNMTNSQSQTNIKAEGSVPLKKTSVSKQSNTMLMSMLSDIPAANTQTQLIQSNRHAGLNFGQNQRSLNIQRPMQTQSIINTPNPSISQYSAGNINQKQSNDADSGISVEKQKRSRKRKGGVDTDVTNQGYGPRSPKYRKPSDDPLNNVIAIENNISAGAGNKQNLPNIILPGSRVDIKLKNDQSGQSNPTISYISTQQNNPSKFGVIQDVPGSITNANMQRRDNIETDNIKKERKRKRAESSDYTRSASGTTPSLTPIGGQSVGGNNTKVVQLGGQAIGTQVKSGAQANCSNNARPRKSSIGAVLDRLVGAVNQGPSTTGEGLAIGCSSSSSSSSGDSFKSNPDQSTSVIAGQNRADSSTKVASSSTSSAKAPKYSRGSADQFAIKQGSSGLKLTVTKTKPATPPSSSVPEAVSKILNLGTTSNIKYTIPKLSKTQQAAQSSSSISNPATSSDQGPSLTNSSDSNAPGVTSILASTSTSQPSSTTVGGAVRKNPTMSFRGTGPGSMIRNPVSSSTHPTNKSLLSSQTTINAPMNRPSSSMQPDSINIQRISSSSTTGHPQQMLMPANRQNPRFNIPTPLGQNRFVSTIITPNAVPQFPLNSPSIMANQSEMTNYAATQSTINIRPMNTKFMSSSANDANNISSSRSHINNQQTNLSGTSSMVSFTPRPSVDSTQTSTIPRPSSSVVSGPPQFYVRQTAFNEALPTSQTISLTDNIATPALIASTVSHSAGREDFNVQPNISTFPLLPRPVGRIQGTFSYDQVEQSSQDNDTGRAPKSTSFDDDNLIEFPVRATGVSSSSDIPKSAISSTPSSPADCNQQVEVLPPPPLIPIDSLDDEQPPRDSIASSDNDASDRLSIVDINETMADSISSAGTPKAYAISEMTSPPSIEHNQQQPIPISPKISPGVVSGSESAHSIKSPDNRIEEAPSHTTAHDNADELQIDTQINNQNDCFSKELQEEKSPARMIQDGTSDATNNQDIDSAQGNEIEMTNSDTTQDQSNYTDKVPQLDATTETTSASKITSSSSNEPRNMIEFQTQNKTLNALRGISSYNADSEGTSSSTEGTPTNKSPDQELDNDYGKMSNIINTDEAPTAMEVDSFSATSAPEPSISYDGEVNQSDNINVDKLLDKPSDGQVDQNYTKDSSEAQTSSREPDILSDQPTANTNADSANELTNISSILPTQSNNGTIEEISQATHENSDQALSSNSDSNRLSTNESDANVISAQSPSSV